MTKCLVFILLPVMLAAQPWHGDTVGGTTYDWQASGPMPRMIANDTLYGIHVAWMFSASPSPWTDRNMRYNFYDYASRHWMFNQGATFMDYGVSAFSPRTGFGSLDVNPKNHHAYISGHQGSVTPHCVQDAAPGSGVFEDCDGTSGADQYLWPKISIDSSGVVHVGVMDNATRTRLYYTRIRPWCTWAVPIHIPYNDPAVEDYCIAASLMSHGIAISWLESVDPPNFYYGLSTDGGNNWDAQVQLDPPPAFTPGSETIPVFYISSNSLLWDNHDHLHITVTVLPVVDGVTYINPSEVWDYDSTRTRRWVRIHRSQYVDIHPFGTWAGLASRPMLAVHQDGRLFCVWEQYDSINTERVTGYARADIWAAGSNDGGDSWMPAVRVTAPDSTTHRYPSVARVADRYLDIACLQDLQAGANVQGEGDPTDNPIVVLRVPVDSIVPPPIGAISAAPGPESPTSLSVSPNPFRDCARLCYSTTGPLTLRIYDASGRVARTFRDTRCATGTGTTQWNGADDSGQQAPPGIYFVRLATGKRVLEQKVIRVP